MQLANYRFDLNEWLPRFSLEEEYGHFTAQIITSPRHICQNEWLRREMPDEYDWGDPVPMDIFVMADGEPPERHMTKIGGLPYRPAGAKWPVRRYSGDPMVFFGQFNFADSTDITGELPGDVLLIFGDNAYGPETLHFEWQPFGLGSLIEKDEIPRPRPRDIDPEEMERYSMTPFSPCYGHILRTVNFPDAKRRDESTEEPRCRGLEVRSDFLLPQYQATQIGEAPNFIEGHKQRSSRACACSAPSCRMRTGHTLGLTTQSRCAPTEFGRFLEIG